MSLYCCPKWSSDDLSNICKEFQTGAAGFIEPSQLESRWQAQQTQPLRTALRPSSEHNSGRRSSVKRKLESPKRSLG